MADQRLYWSTKDTVSRSTAQRADNLGTVTTSTSLRRMARSWERSLRARNLAPKTVMTYMDAALQLCDFLDVDEGREDVAAADLRRDHVEGYLAEVLAKSRPATANNRFRALQQFTRFLHDEGEIEANPMARMKPPMVPDEPPDVLTIKEVKAILATCKGGDFVARRDEAILRLFADTGLRLNELAGLTVDDVDLDESDEVTVLGKGRRPRAVPFGSKAGQALDRYRRLRDKHRAAASPAFWLGLSGPMTDNGIGQMVRKRGRMAGVEGMHPHLFRHFFAHNYLANDGREGDLMRLAGWKSRQMLERYGASAASSRAKAAHRKMSLGDQL